MSDRYLKQIKTGYVYIWTQELEDKGGFVEVDKKDADKLLKDYGKKKRIPSVKVEKEKPEIKETIIEDPTPIIDEEELKESAVIDDEENGIDDEILIIRNLKTKNAVEKYMLEKFQTDIDRRKSLSDLKNIALNAYEDSLKK